MKLNTIIIDDEEPARELIKAFLREDTEINILGVYKDGFEGLKAINQLTPDLVILDIQMPKITGFEMLELMEIHPIIIFSTAYDDFAIKAFEMNAVDYLLKPYSKKRLFEAIEKAKEKKQSAFRNQKPIETLLDQISERDEYIKRVVVKIGTKIHVIPTDYIHYIESQDDYVLIYTAQGKYLKQKTMKFYEAHLDPQEFVRIHRSYIVKVSAIDRLEIMGKENYVLLLKDQTKLKVSKSGYPKLREILNF